MDTRRPTSQTRGVGLPQTITHHPSTFPEALRETVHRSLATRSLAGCVHYVSVRQTLAWLDLHRRLSPARSDEGARLYERCFDEAVKDWPAQACHVIGLGCGGGWKEALLLRRLHAAGVICRYTPLDVSTAMVVTAAGAAREILPDLPLHPIVADLAQVADLGPLVASVTNAESPRLVTCFGMLPSFEPAVLRRALGSLLRSGDRLLLSANLAPGADSRAGTLAVLPQYDNATTRAWLWGGLTELGFKREDGELRFGVEEAEEIPGLWRIVGDLVLQRTAAVAAGQERFTFDRGDTLRVFFSYRYTPALCAEFLKAAGLAGNKPSLSASGEEGLFAATTR
jgi:L-histidine Nalpha-methyltransferase